MTGRDASGEERRGRETGSSFVADLRSVLRERNFRRLFATRLISQTGDGAFNAGLGSYVFFSAQIFPDPAAAAAAFAVLYLPYSLIGPFAGVFIDRWSRRQILVWSALSRAVFVGLTASLVASGRLGVPLYAAALTVFGVNRFFLSALSAALPHVVSKEKLVMANAVGPTSGTIVAFAGGLAGLGIHLATGGGYVGSAATLIAAGACYVLAGLCGATMRRDLLGPRRDPPEPRRDPPEPRRDPPEPRRDPPEPRSAGIVAELAAVAVGLGRGARYLWARRGAAYGLATMGSIRFLYGTLTVMTLLLYRNYFYPTSSANVSLAHFTLVVIASALGYGAAAVATPMVTARLAKPTWMTILLATGGVVTGVLGPTFQQVPFLVIGFGLGLVAQGVKICVDTIVQQQVDDAFLGRVFSLYDMLFNVAFVLGALVAALFMPADGKSYPLVVMVAVGYLFTAVWYALVHGHASGGSPEAGPSTPGSPSAAAQPSSS